MECENIFLTGLQKKNWASVASHTSTATTLLNKEQNAEVSDTTEAQEHYKSRLHNYSLYTHAYL